VQSLVTKRQTIAPRSYHTKKIAQACQSKHGSSNKTAGLLKTEPKKLKTIKLALYILRRRNDN
jgi:hypothetical protein